MFAFAIAETSTSTRKGNPQVLLARDRLGIKPLYYALVDGALVFSSEVRSLLASGQIEPRLSKSALKSYLLFGSVAEPMTLVEGVCSLPPGHRIVLSAATHDSNIHSSHIGISPNPHSHRSRPRNLNARMRLHFCGSLLRGSVADNHMVADVPIGIFLSSGIDSTALVSLAAQKGGPVHTLTVVFEEREFSEAEIARRTAQKFGTIRRKFASAARTCWSD